jgi:hypothetical protein
MADLDLFMGEIVTTRHRTPDIHRAVPPQKPRSSQDHEVIAMDDLDTFEFPRADLVRVKGCNAPGKLGSVQVANAQHIALDEAAFTA